MKVVFEPVSPDESWKHEVDMTCVPRRGEDVELDGREYIVQAVIWAPLAPEPQALVLLRCPWRYASGRPAACAASQPG